MHYDYMATIFREEDEVSSVANGSSQKLTRVRCLYVQRYNGTCLTDEPH